MLAYNELFSLKKTTFIMQVLVKDVQIDNNKMIGRLKKKLKIKSEKYISAEMTFNSNSYPYGNYLLLLYRVIEII